MAKIDYDQIVASIREEVKKYHDTAFSDEDEFTRDMNLLSDDLSAIALSVERKFGVKLDKSEYRSVTNVHTYAEAVRSHLE